MQKSIEELYQEAKRFDECDFYQTPEYSVIVKKQLQIRKQLWDLFGPRLTPLLEDYTAAIGEEMDMENRHFFEQGYLMGQRSLS